MNPYDPAQAIDFSGRSPYKLRVMPGVPPAPQRTKLTDVQVVDGELYVDGVRLQDIGKTANELLVNNPPAQDEPKPVYDDSQYGESFNFQVLLVAGQPVKVLDRPNNRRIQLTIQNQNAVGNVFYAFDKAADTVNGIIVPAGGNRLWDTVVPQGDLWLIAPANSTVVIEYINKDVTKR